MRAFNPFTGVFYREALQMSRMTREMFCLMEGRHVHPSTLYPGGVGTVPTVQLFTDYLVRLMKYVEFMKKVVPLHDDLFDFFYEALPGYEKVGQRRVLLGCWGSFQNPDTCDFRYETMSKWGKDMYVTPGVVVDGQLVTTDLVDINLGIRILLGSSFYDDWIEGEKFVAKDPLGNVVDQRHPWNQTTTPKPQKRDLGGGKYTWVMSPRWFDQRTSDYLALDTGGGPLARLWTTALAGIVDIGYVKSTGKSVKINLPKTAFLPEVEFEWKIPKWSNTIERDRARTYFQAYAAAAALLLRGASARAEVHRGRTATWTEFKVPDEAIGCGFHEAVRGVLSHHVVIRKGKIANYHPYPPTPWNASPRDSFGTPGPYEDAVQNTPLFEENGPDNFKGIDIMRTVRSFDPCLPCGVHMALGEGKELEVKHSPTFGVQVKWMSSEDDGDVMRAMLALHRDALARVLEIAPTARDAFAADPAVSSALALHGLHPVAAEVCVRAALARVRGAELVSFEGGVATVRAASAADEHAIDDLVCAAAPDVELRIERVDVSIDRLSKHATCDLCSRPIAETHEHVIDPKSRKLECTCGACARLFDDASSKRRVPARHERLTSFRLTDEAWSALDLPIDVAFFHRSSAASRVVASYPGPAGATESALSLEGWRALAEENPVLDELAPDVEALLVNRREGAREYFRVSIDRCYELVGVIRKNWRGLSGGDAVWSAVRAFFDALENTCPI